jgi:hypothetical protein
LLKELKAFLLDQKNRSLLTTTRLSIESTYYTQSQNSYPFFQPFIWLRFKPLKEVYSSVLESWHHLLIAKIHASFISGLLCINQIVNFLPWSEDGEGLKLLTYHDQSLQMQSGSVR